MFGQAGTCTEMGASKLLYEHRNLHCTQEKHFYPFHCQNLSGETLTANKKLFCVSYLCVLRTWYIVLKAGELLFPQFCQGTDL